MDAATSAPSEIEVRYTDPKDAPYLKQWLLDPEVRGSFPMIGEMEVDDAVIRWISFCRHQCSLTILKNGIPCGMATLYLQPYRRLAHQCEFGIIVGSGFRGTGIGSYLMSCLLHLAKVKFKIKVIHLQVCADNPAIHFYKRFGFKSFGMQESWMRDENGDTGRLFMERTL